MQRGVTTQTILVAVYHLVGLQEMLPFHVTCNKHLKKNMFA